MGSKSLKKVPHSPNSNLQAQKKRKKKKKMPCLYITTNLNLDGVNTDPIFSEATTAISTIIGKPQKVTPFSLSLFPQSFVGGVNTTNYKIKFFLHFLVGWFYSMIHFFGYFSSLAYFNLIWVNIVWLFISKYS